MSATQRFLARVLPAEERSDALWLAGSLAGLGALRLLAYPLVLSSMTTLIPSPRLQELGFPLRATAVADVLWLAVAAVLAWALLRYTRAPKAVAVFVILVGVLAGLVTTGSRVALDAVEALVHAPYQRASWSDLQSVMLTLAQAVGVVLGAWAAQLGEHAADDATTSGTLLPALGLDAQPLPLASRMALLFGGAIALSELVTATVAFGPQVRTVILYAHGHSTSGRLSVALGVAVGCAYVFVPGLVAYWAIKRTGSPRSVWLAFAATALATLVSSARSLPTAIAQVRQTPTMAILLLTPLATIAFVILARVVSPLLGVWLATRMSVPSATLPAEENAQTDAGGTDG